MYYFWLGKEADKEICLTMEFGSGNVVNMTVEEVDNWHCDFHRRYC